MSKSSEAITTATVPEVSSTQALMYEETATSDLVLVESKDFAQVVFADVHDDYAENAQIECEFALNELLKADETDWIGVYKVGFSSHRDFVCKAMVDTSMVVDNHGKVCFPG